MYLRIYFFVDNNLYIFRITFVTEMFQHPICYSQIFDEWEFFLKKITNIKLSITKIPLTIHSKLNYFSS